MLVQPILFKHIAEDKSDSASVPPDEHIIHVGEDKLFPKGNCWKYGCSCTPLDQCATDEEVKPFFRKKKKKRKEDKNAIISEEEKTLLRQFRQQQKWESQYDDFGPIGGNS